MLEHAALFLDHDRMEESSACQPGHERRDLHRVPAPVTAPAEDIIRPPSPEYESEGEEQPCPQGPAACQANPAVVSATRDQCRDRERVRDDEGDEAKIEHRGMDDHARVTEKRIQSASVIRREQDAIGRSERIWLDSVEGLIQLCKGVLEKDIHT